MKKFLIMLSVILMSSEFVFADEILSSNSSVVSDTEQAYDISDAEQIIEMTQNKVIVNIQKQPLNERSKQKIVLKKNWFVLNIQVNGKVKINPVTSTYEVQ